MKKEILIIDKLLKKRFNIHVRSQKPSDAVNLLVATILSQNTNDKNSYKAYNNLKQKYSSWEEVARLRASQIEKLIRVAGLGKQKSKAIKNLLISLIHEQGKISLSYLDKLNSEEVLSELTKFPGIGIKTASCVLLFSMMRNVCPVDTHVHRTLNRIGLIKTSSPDKTFYAINKNLPEGIAHSFHTNLIRLGREICKPGKPGCGNCPVEKVCSYTNKITGVNETLFKEKSFMLLDNV